MRPGLGPGVERSAQDQGILLLPAARPATGIISAVEGRGPSMGADGACPTPGVDHYLVRAGLQVDWLPPRRRAEIEARHPLGTP
jgi:hypothetical protein